MPEAIVKLYKSSICPILEYGNIIWSPCFTLDNKAVERVQRRATKLVGALNDCTHSEQLEALNLPSLLCRRTRADMIYLYRIMHSDVDISFSPVY